MTVPAGGGPADKLLQYRPDLAGLLAQRDEPGYRFHQVYEHLLRRPCEPFASATSLPADLRPVLDGLGWSSLTPAARRDSSDGTTKLLISCRDRSLIETVLMRYARRTTICVSSQVGCPVGCAFCATAELGFRRNLSSAEIVDQVRHAQALLASEQRAVSNVVFMGMGEPMLNLQAVLGAVRTLTDPQGFGLGRRAIALSTVGIPAGIRRLAQEIPQASLALSLQSTDELVRRRLIPSRHRHPLKDIMSAIRDHFATTHRKLLVEYLVFPGANDDARHARELATLLRGIPVTVNLLRWNPGRPDFPLQPHVDLETFRVLLSGMGLEAVIRESKGADIDAACGQLAAHRAGYREQGSGGKGGGRRSRAPDARRERGPATQSRA